MKPQGSRKLAGPGAFPLHVHPLRLSSIPACMARPEKRRNSLIWRRFPRRIEKRSAPSVAGAAPWSLAPATWPSTLVLRLALQVPLQPPRLPRVSDFPGPSPGEEGRSSVRPFGPRLFGLGILGSPARAETLGASEKGGRQPSGRRRLLRRPREGWGPNPVLARARGAPQAPLLLGCVSRHPESGSERPEAASVTLCQRPVLPPLPAAASRTCANSSRVSRCGIRRGSGWGA